MELTWIGVSDKSSEANRASRVSIHGASSSVPRGSCAERFLHTSRGALCGSSAGNHDPSFAWDLGNCGIGRSWKLYLLSHQGVQSSH